MNIPGPTEGARTRERRQVNRKLFRANLEIEWGSAILNAIVRDIGPTGLFAELSPPLWVGAAFRARLIVDPILILHCTVRRVEPGRGFAVTFEVPEESGRQQLETMLAALPAV